MLNFEYFTPTKIFFGKGEENKLGETLKNSGYKKILLHYGGGSIKKNGLYDKLIQNIETAGLSWCELGGVEPNPKIGLVREGIELSKKEEVDFILAIGGGSVIDSAKGIALGLANEIDPWDMIINKIMPKKSFPIGVVLTLASAGSEMSASCVLTNPEFNLKRSINHDFNRPVFAFMNPEHTFSVSKYQTGCGIVDIMMHTLERYFTINKENDLTDRIAEGLLVAVKNAGRVAIKNPNDYEARATLMWASSLSHNDLTGCGKERLMPAHKIEHDISGLFDHVAHAAGLSVIFPAWAKYIYKHDVGKFSQLANRVWGVEMNHDYPEKTALDGIERMKEYFISLDMPVTMKEIGIHPDNYEMIANKTTNNGKDVVYSYIPLSKEDIMEIYKLAE